MFYCVRSRGNRFWLIWGSGVCTVSMLVLGNVPLLSTPTVASSMLTEISQRTVYTVSLLQIQRENSNRESAASSASSWYTSSRLPLASVWGPYLGMLPVRSVSPTLRNRGAYIQLNTVLSPTFPDFSLAYQCKMLRHYDLHAMAFPRRSSDAHALPTGLFRNTDLVSLPAQSNLQFPVMMNHVCADVSACVSLIYGGFCVLTLFWVTLYVPETRGVPLGRPMDEVFGMKDDGEGVVDESSALLENQPERVRKASFSVLHEAVA